MRTTALAFIGSGSRNTSLYALFILAPVFMASATHAQQWTVINLEPAGSSQSDAYGVEGGQQVGRAGVGGYYHAAMWTGSAGSWVDLNPSGALGSEAYGAGAGQQVGYASFTVPGGAVHRAALWSGSAGSWVNLNPAGSTFSEAAGVSGGQQVGVACVGGVCRASLWTGTAASWVDLNPGWAGASNSTASGVGDAQQVGYAQVGGVDRASLWTGTAESWVDLHPAGADSSWAFAAHAGQQVGRTHPGPFGRAALWSGTAESWVDLHPPAAYSSEARGVHAGQQVGWADVGGVTRASLWSGTAASWMDLHSFLPASYVTSRAYAIWHDGVGFTYVVGRGNILGGGGDALMWVKAPVTIAAANPPASNPYGAGVFRDVLQNTTAALTPQGIGVAGTPAEGPYTYATISVTFSSAPAPAPLPTNIGVECTDSAANGPEDCPTVTGVTGSAAGPYQLTLSAPPPPRECITFTFVGTSAGQKLQYQVLPGDTNLDGTVNTQDLLFLVQRISDGSANQPANFARYNINRSQESGGVRVTTQDLLRLVQLLNGVNATQVFNGATVAACP
ncbi:MAG TPA: hypothetical protein VGM03_06600 [Phycisphaerae bacterium]